MRAIVPDRPERWDTARRELQEWVAAGRLRVMVEQAFPLAKAAEAHRRLEQRQTQGKLILLPAARRADEKNEAPAVTSGASCPRGVVNWSGMGPA